MTIKNLAIIIFAIFIVKNTMSQSFKYDDYELNNRVTFNMVINHVEDKQKIITEPSLYIKGESIKYYDVCNSVTELSFFDDSQILKEIDINHIECESFVKQLMSSIKRQLVKPKWGYEIKEYRNSSEDTYWIEENIVTYDCFYIFEFDDFEIWIIIDYSALRATDKENPQNTTFGIPSEISLLLKEEYDKYGRNYYTISPMHNFSAEIVSKDKYRNLSYPNNKYVDKFEYLNKW